MAFRDDLSHVDDNERDVVLLVQRGRLPKTYLWPGLDLPSVYLPT